MSEPRRLLEGGGSEDELALLRSARHDAPPPGSRGRTLVALGLAGSVGATVTTTTAASTATAALFKWIGVGMLAGMATVGTVAVVQPGAAPSRPQVAAKGFAPEATRKAAVAAQLPAAEPPPAAPPVPPAGEIPSAQPSAAPVDPPHASAKPSLADEVAALDVAREALAAGDAGRALRALDQHDQRFAGGMLGPEATVLRIEALLLRGDRASATRLGEAFLAAHPRSPHASRLRSLLGAPAP
jgi:hypothetical protein